MSEDANKEIGRDPKDPILDSEQTKWLLIKAALPLFARKGFDGTTVRDVADAAGVNLSLVSYHFKGKLGLYRSCIEEFGQARQSKSKEILQLPQSFEEFKLRFRFLIEDMIAFQVEHPSVCQIVFREIDEGLPIAKDIFEKTLMQTFTSLVEFIEHAKKKGFLRSSIDPMSVAMMTQASLFHMMRTDKVRKEYFNLSIMDEGFRKQTIENLMDMFFNGILNQESTGEKR